MMKRLLCVLLSLCLLCAIVPLAAADEGLSVDGAWVVLVPESPTAYERFAADKLKAGLAEALGTELTETTAATENYIAVGSASSADVSGLADNGYRIQAVDGSIHLNGTGVRGLQAGAYRFLEEFCGRKVYTHSITVTQEKDSIAVPADTDIVYEPFFEYTETDWRSPRDPEYAMANGLDGGNYCALPAEMGGTVDYLGGFCHTIGGLCETASYEESHPEYLALHDGERTVDQPCLTNPDVLEIAKRNVLRLAEERHDPEASLQIISVTQNDNQNYCQCDACRAFEEAHGGVPSATMLYFVNQIADAVKAAGYDNIAIDTFAYQYTRKAPAGIAPRDNVIVRLCTIECCFAHALDDKNCDENVDLMNDLRDWSKICDRIYVWDYTTNYAKTCMVFPDFGVIQRNIQVFYENNVKGVYEEGNYYIYSCDTEFGELRAYMIAKCLQDPYCDLDGEVNGFLDAYYGPGGPQIRAALDLYTKKAGNKKGHLHIYDNAKNSLQLSDREIVMIDGYWAAAKNAAQTEEQAANVARSELSWRYWKAAMDKGEFSLLNARRFKERQQLYDDIVASGATSISEGSEGDYLDCLCPQYAPVEEWNDYEADESGAKARLFFYSKLFEPLTYLFSAFGFYYKIFKAANRVS